MIVYKFVLKLCREILPILFWILVLFGFDKPYIAVLTLLTALLHEVGHYIAFLVLKCDTGMPLGHFSGFRFRQKANTSYAKSILIYGAGAMMNILTSTAVLPFCRGNRYLTVFVLIGYATAVSNLLPIKGYDGYNILADFLRSRGKDTGLRILDGGSFVICVVLTFTALYLMYYRNGGYWIYGMFMLMLLGEISDRLNLSVLEI